MPESHAHLIQVPCGHVSMCRCMTTTAAISRGICLVCIHESEPHIAKQWPTAESLRSRKDAASVNIVRTWDEWIENNTEKEEEKS